MYIHIYICLCICILSIYILYTDQYTFIYITIGINKSFMCICIKTVFCIYIYIYIYLYMCMIYTSLTAILWKICSGKPQGKGRATPGQPEVHWRTRKWKSRHSDAKRLGHHYIIRVRRARAKRQ